MTMRSPAAAMAWEFRRRHRWGLVGVGVYLLALPAIRLLVGGEGVAGDLNDELKFALAVVIPASVAFYYLLAVFSFGFAGDLAGRQSVYPARMFTLPVGSAALAGWPMLYGGLAMVVLWTVTRRPSCGRSSSDTRCNSRAPGGLLPRFVAHSVHNIHIAQAIQRRKPGRNQRHVRVRRHETDQHRRGPQEHGRAREPRGLRG